MLIHVVKWLSDTDITKMVMIINYVIIINY